MLGSGSGREGVRRDGVVDNVYYVVVAFLLRGRRWSPRATVSAKSSSSISRAYWSWAKVVALFLVPKKVREECCHWPTVVIT